MSGNKKEDVMSVGIWQLVLVLLIVFVIFGAGKLPKVMAELGRGIKALKENAKDDGKDGSK
jgi:sec-independent protein translocase protein TatA